ncbi:MAG: ATP-binding protein [Pseudomonadota bacterium]
MWHRTDLKLRIYLPLSLIMTITLVGALLSLWYTHRMDNLFNEELHEHIAAYHNAAALESALVNQKGYVSYFFQDHDPAWLSQLEAYRRIFRERLADARAATDDKMLQMILEDISREYDRYVSEKNTVIDLYSNGSKEKGLALHQTVRARFFHILELTARYKEIHNTRITVIQMKVHQQARDLRIISVAAIVGMALIGLLLAGIIGYQVLGPIQQLAEITNKGGSPADSGDVVERLSHSVRDLIADAGQKETALEKSRESLLQAEKLAMVGKLAAGVAHSVRNPLTSVKMRLFSLNRSLALKPDQQEDFDVISEEIRHVDAIVGNFLEFSRPPKLTVQRISPSIVVDQAVQLLTHRLKSYDVSVTVKRERVLDEVSADPEQLKEVMANIIINACEAMVDGGAITIVETTLNSGGQSQVQITFTDTGPGIPETVLERIFEPFFTTKDDGTGLGLSIVDRIMREHQGAIDVSSAPGQGTTFVLSLPLATGGQP